MAIMLYMCLLRPAIVLRVSTHILNDTDTTCECAHVVSEYLWQLRTIFTLMINMLYLHVFTDYYECINTCLTIFSLMTNICITYMCSF